MYNINYDKLLQLTYISKQLVIEGESGLAPPGEPIIMVFHKFLHLFNISIRLTGLQIKFDI